MHAFVIEQPRRAGWRKVEDPKPRAGEALLQVRSCALCRTDLHVWEGELALAHYPIVPGHQVVASVLSAPEESGLSRGDRVGVTWLAETCGECFYCRNGRENLCEKAHFTGATRPGGFAECLAVDARFCFKLPSEMLDDVHAAPLLCGGVIGWRALSFCREERRLGFYGFGSAAHQLLQVARYLKKEVFVFVRPGGDAAAERLAQRLGAAWVGEPTTPPPLPLDAALLFAPVGELVPLALRAVRPGGKVICAGIHMTPIPSLNYSDLWGERELRSVANLTRKDAEEFLPLAFRIPVETHVQVYSMEQARQALEDLKSGRVTGSAVLVSPEKTGE